MPVWVSKMKKVRTIKNELVDHTVALSKDNDSTEVTLVLL